MTGDRSLVQHRGQRHLPLFCRPIEEQVVYFPEASRTSVTELVDTLVSNLHVPVGIGVLRVN